MTTSSQSEVSGAFADRVHPIDELSHEHHVLRGVLAAVEAEAARMMPAFDLRLGFWLQVLDFLEHFTDREHQAKEVEALWPELERAGLCRQHGPLCRLKDAWEQGRAARGRMVEAVASQDVPGLARAAVACVKQLRLQIDTEETLLFPLAFELLSPAAVARLREQFDQIATDLGSEECARTRALAARLSM